MKRMPATYVPVVRYPHYYGLTGRDMGLKYTFRYNMTFADPDFTGNFFETLKQIGTPGDPNTYQLNYNAQQKNVLDVTGPVLDIDAPSVEKWLAKHLINGPGYTIVFINWYSQSSFQFHFYSKTDEPDPDTGKNFGADLDNRKLIAWGGGDSRLWFYDLSAGPEAWTDNWNVDNPDLNGDGKVEYRMPPIWEYTAGGYRNPYLLSRDLALITRFVGIDALFTTSPLYDPMNTSPGIGGRKIINISMLEDDPASSGLDLIKRENIQTTFAALEPFYKWKTELVDVNPIDPGAQRALQIYTGVINEPDCWNTYGDRLAQLFCYFNTNRDMYIPAYEKNDYVAGMFAYYTTEENMGEKVLQTGYAYDNWTDGTQSYSFGFNTAYLLKLGLGFTNITTHELGHHFGFAHPFSGYDSENDDVLGPVNQFYFVYSGDESDTVMHYMYVSQGFSEFERDNLYRWEMAGYLNWANGLLDDVLAHPEAVTEQEDLARAEKCAEKAIENFNQWEYLHAAANARKAYEIVARSAEKLGVMDANRIMLEATQEQPIPFEREVDTLRFPDD
jgi:hypothetical protein